MKKQLNGYSEEILRKMYLALFPAMALNGLISCLGTLVDSFIVSGLLGDRAMAALGLTSPITTIFWLFINVVSNGAAVFAGKCLGRGERDKLNGGFTMCLVVLMGVGAALGATLAIFHTPIARLLGATDDLLPMAEQYILGLAISAPAVAMSGPLYSFLILDNKQKMTFITTAIGIVVNASCDVLFVKFLNMGMFGMSLASAVSCYATVVYDLTHFVKKSSHIHLERRLINWKELPEIVHTGLPVASNELCNFLKPVMFNRILLKFGGVLAVSAFAAEGSLASFFGSLCGGAGGLTLTVGSVIAGEEDGASLNRFAKVVYKYGFMIVFGACALLFIFAGYLVRPFCGGNAEVAVIAARACRCLAVALVLNVLVMITVKFYQALGYGKLVTVLNLLDYFILPVAWSLALSPSLGADGSFYALFLAEATTLLVIFVLLVIRLKKLRISLSEIIQFGRSFDVPEEDRLDTTLYSMDDVIGISEHVEEFCLEHGTDSRCSSFSALAVEEMAGNIVEHGFADGKKHAVDIRVLYRKGETVIRLRDDCKPFDPMRQLEEQNADEPSKNIGIKLIAKLSKNMTYQKIFGMNVTTITVASAGGADATA